MKLELWKSLNPENLEAIESFENNKKLMESLTKNLNSLKVPDYVFYAEKKSDLESEYLEELKNLKSYKNTDIYPYMLEEFKDYQKSVLIEYKELIRKGIESLKDVDIEQFKDGAKKFENKLKNLL